MPLPIRSKLPGSGVLVMTSVPWATRQRVRTWQKCGRACAPCKKLRPKFVYCYVRRKQRVEGVEKSKSAAVTRSKAVEFVRKKC